MPGGLEMLREAEQHVHVEPASRWLSVACGLGELELYLADKYGCQVLGIDANEGFIGRAQERARLRKLEPRVSFRVGDGNALDLAPDGFDLVLCSGALCGFVHDGLREFHRVLVDRGQAIVLEVIWRTEAVPKPVSDYWSQGGLQLSTSRAYLELFAEHGFEVRAHREHHEPRWWDAFYQGRGGAPHWVEQQEHYRQDAAHLGVGMFVLEKA